MIATEQKMVENKENLKENNLDVKNIQKNNENLLLTKEESKNQKEDILERIYIVNLRKKTIVAPRWKRAKKAVKVLKEFVKRHMKVEEVKLDNEVNNLIWSRGAKNPVMKLKIRVIKKGNVAKVMLAK